MIRPIILGGAMLIAVPALAQSAGQPSQPASQAGVPTTTNDHDPAEKPADAGRPAAAPNFGSQVNGGIRSGSPGAGPGALSGVGGPAESMRDYPRCSRTVTDRCTQARGPRR